MQTLFIIASLATTLASAFDVVQDGQGRHYYLLPVSRVRRETNLGETKWDVNKNNNGKIEVQHGGNIYDDGDHRFDGRVYASQSWKHPEEPSLFRGDLQYNHNSGSSFGLEAEHKTNTRTSIGATGSYNLYRNGPFHLDVKGSYGRTFGHGRFKTGRPSFDTGLYGAVDF